MKSLSFQQRVFAGFFITLLFVLSVSVISYIRISELQDDLVSIDQTQEIIKFSNLVLININQAESSCKSYILTGERKWLEPYNESLSKIQPSVDRLEALVQDQYSGGFFADSLKLHASEKIYALSSSIWRFNKGERNLAEASLLKDLLMDKIRISIDSIKVREGVLLEQKRAISRKNVRNTTIFFAIALLIIISLLYILFHFIKETFARQKLTEQQVLKSNKKLQELVSTTHSQAEELQRQKEELVLKNKELLLQRRQEEEARQEADRANKAKSAFLATMSHEIRTPMNGVLGMTALLGETALTEEQQEYLNIIQSSGENLLAVINDILDFSKIESGSVELDAHDFDLRDCLEDVLDLFSVRASEIGLDLIYSIDPRIPKQLLADGMRLKQILINLVGNAIKFTPMGEVFVEVKLVSEAGSQLFISFDVKDTGIGIPNEKLSRLFQAFSQVDSSTTRKYGGTGLGLVISERLVNLMGGTIVVESLVGKGSSFRFTIPCNCGHDLNRKIVNLNLRGMEGKRVLIVDDNHTNLRILGTQLKLWNLDALTADSGAEALAILAGDEKFDLIITDMQMPGMSGRDLGQRIKDRYPHIPIVLLSSVGEETRKNCAGIFSTILTKPVKQQQLLKVIQMELRNLTESVDPVPRTRELSACFAQEYPLRIMVAEDNLINQKLISRVLGQLGYSIELVENGRVALDRINTAGLFDVILMDIQMPEMDGLETTAAIRQLQIPQPVIIALTANALIEDMEACLHAGMDDYLSKPLNLNDLKESLKRAFGSVEKRSRPLACVQGS